MPIELDPKPLINQADMQIVERVLGMSSGYVLDFSNRTFDDFIANTIGIDASADRYSIDGGSKAKRLRRILHSLGGQQQATLLRALLHHRDNPIRAERMDVLDERVRQAYMTIIHDLEKKVSDVDTSYAASAWTGRRTISEQATIVRNLAPLALREIDELAFSVASKRFNDPVTADALDCLRELHRQLGELISATDRGLITREAVEAIEANRQNLARHLKEGAKLAVVAPTMTFGIMHVLAWVTGVPIDSTLVSTVFGTIVGADVLKSINKKSSLAP